MAPTFTWPLVDQFIDRSRSLERLEEWWASDEKMPIALYGRRRVGKSWLVRRFAHGKPAVLLVAEQLAPGAQLDRFARQLEPVLGLRPDLPDVASLLRVLFRAARDQRLLVVIDEFPWLMPSTTAGVTRQLSSLQAVMEEERDASALKLMICGSTVSQMESLFAERSPLHGRLIRHELAPLSFGDAAGFLDNLEPIERFERFAISGGMPRYLDLLGRGSLRDAICRQVLDRDAPLWNEGRLIIEQELRQPSVYFSVIEQLAGGDKALNEVAQAIRLDGNAVAKYLNTLVDLRLVRRRLPIGAAVTSRTGQWRLDDPFFRFWFRFVFPYQAELESGLGAEDLYAAEVGPTLADHVSPVFEDWCRTWVRAHRGRIAPQVGAWWGPALHELRRSGERTSEEIDLVGMSRGRVTVVGEAKWTNRRLGADILTELRDLKMPALRQAGFRIADDPQITLFAKAGYTAALRRAAEADRGVTLVEVADQLERASTQPQIKE